MMRWSEFAGHTRVGYVAIAPRPRTGHIFKCANRLRQFNRLRIHVK